jgi:hypothetical protein
MFQMAKQAFYESQKDQYDSFREQMLFARPVLAECIPIRRYAPRKLFVAAQPACGFQNAITLDSASTLTLNCKDA